MTQTYNRYVPLAKVDTAFVTALIFIGLDGITTSFALLQLTGANEANPVVQAAIATIGVVPAMFVKILVGAAFAAFLCYSAEFGYPLSFMQRDWRLRRVPRLRTCVRAYRMLWVLALAHAAVVVNNIIVIGMHS